MACGWDHNAPDGSFELILKLLGVTAPFTHTHRFSKRIGQKNEGAWYCCKNCIYAKASWVKDFLETTAPYKFFTYLLTYLEREREIERKRERHLRVHYIYSADLHKLRPRNFLRARHKSPKNETTKPHSKDVTTEWSVNKLCMNTKTCARNVILGRSLYTDQIVELSLL